jgi:hypothetical protein
MRSALRHLACLAACCLLSVSAQAAPQAEKLAGSWACQEHEGGSDVAMILDYRRSDDFLVGEMKEDNGAVLLDVWLDDGEAKLALRRLLSYDATVEMRVVEETADSVKVAGELRHLLDTTTRVREEVRFTGSDLFRAVWEADSGAGWQVTLERTCRRI